MRQVIFAFFLATFALTYVAPAHAQTQRPYRVGVIHEGGPYDRTVDGLKDGLRELGLQVDKDVVLEIHDMKGNRAAVGDTARGLEQAKIDLLYTVATSVTLPAKGATTGVPIVFVSGGDAVEAGLVESFARPGGRLTGVETLTVELTSKRLEILKEILPNIRRVVTFYDRNNSVALASAKSAREAAQRLNIEFMERQVASVDELRRGLDALAPGDADAYFYTPNAMVNSQTKLIMDTARTKRLPTMFGEPGAVAQGALAAYGVNYYEAGRLSAKYVQRVLTGTSPKDLPVEKFRRYGLSVNLKTARDLGITIPQSVLARADEVIE